MFTEEMREDLISGLLNIFENQITMIVLYGSVVRGTENDDSDIDVAIILKKDMSVQTKDRFIDWATDMDLRYDRVFSIIDIRADQMEKWGDVLPFYKSINSEGVVLWKAA